MRWSVEIGILTTLFTIASGSRGMWTVLQQGQYYISLIGMRKMYNESQAFCANEGGQLALVKNGEIQDFIEKVILNDSDTGPYGFYIGMRYQGNIALANIPIPGFEKNFTWNDGDATVYSNWAFPFPVNAVNTDCVIVGPDGLTLKGFKWHNVDCTKSRGYICERGTGSTITTSTTVTRTTAISKQGNQLIFFMAGVGCTVLIIAMIIGIAIYWKRTRFLSEDVSGECSQVHENAAAESVPERWEPDTTYTEINDVTASSSPGDCYDRLGEQPSITSVVVYNTPSPVYDTVE